MISKSRTSGINVLKAWSPREDNSHYGAKSNWPELTETPQREKMNPFWFGKSSKSDRYTGNSPKGSPIG